MVLATGAANRRPGRSRPAGYRPGVPQEVIPILRVTDAARSVAWYERLGFLLEWEHRFEPDLPAFVSISRGHARIYLSEHEGDASPDSLLYIRHSQLDALAYVFPLFFLGMLLVTAVFLAVRRRQVLLSDAHVGGPGCMDYEITS